MNHAAVKQRMEPLVKIKPKYQVTIPYTVRERVPLIIGDLVAVEARRNIIIIKPKDVIDRAAKDDIEAAIAEGLNDFEKGRVFGPFASVKEFKSALKNKKT